MAKAKLKTNKSIAKRIKVTKTGKLVHGKCGKNHLILRKGKTTRVDRGGRQLSDTFSKNIKKMIPYS